MTTLTNSTYTFYGKNITAVFQTVSEVKNMKDFV